MSAASIHSRSMVRDSSKIKDFIIFFIFAAILGWLSLLIGVALIPEKELFESFCSTIVTHGLHYPFLALLTSLGGSSPFVSLGWFVSGLIVGFMRPGYSRKQYLVLGFAVVCPFILSNIPSSHNLLPLEPIFYAICMIPAVVGLFFGSFLRNRGGRFLQITVAVVIVLLIACLFYRLSTKEEVQKQSVESRWEENNISHPVYTPEKVWTKKIPDIIGMCSGDWNLDGPPKMIAITKRGELLVIDETGEIKNRFSIEDVSGNLPEVIQWAKIGKDTGAIMHYTGGWPNEITVVGTNGKLLWCYPIPGAAIDSAAWVDINGDGLSELLVGFNGSGGIHLVSSKGNLLWKKSDIANAWMVTGIDAQSGRPGLVLCTTADGAIKIYSSQGDYLRSLPNEKHYVTDFAASEMSPDGTQQIVCLWKVRKGTSRVVGMDLQGNVFWKYPVDAEAVNEVQHSIIAVDITGDNTKEWILRSQKDELVVLDVKGRLILKLDHPAVYNFTSWGVLPRKNKSALIFCAGMDNCVAYTITSRE